MDNKIAVRIQLNATGQDHDIYNTYIYRAIYLYMYVYLAIIDWTAQ